MLTGQGEEVLPADEHSGRTVAERYIGAFDRGVRHGQGRLERGVASGAPVTPAPAAGSVVQWVAQ